MLYRYLFNSYGILKDIIYQFKRRNRNKHNITQLKHATNITKLSVWNYTWGMLDVRISDDYCIKIWSFCAIAPNVEFWCIPNHPTDWLMLEWVPLYMTKQFWRTLVNPVRKWCNLKKTDIEIIKTSVKNKQEKTCHWPIIVDDDVRIWTWAKIMSWVHIWQWAVIAAWAVVTKDIPPYAIAWWVPAKVIKYRFSEDKIKKLLQIDYSNLPIEKLWEIYPETIKEDFDIDYILERLKD